MKTTQTFGRIILIMFLFISISLSYGQQGTVQGKITDKSTKEVVPFATVQLSDEATSSSCISDSTGSYKISAIPGKYKIKVQYVGYRDKVINNVIVSKDSITVVDITLEISTMALKEVTITETSPIVVSEDRMESISVMTGVASSYESDRKYYKKKRAIKSESSESSTAAYLSVDEMPSFPSTSESSAKSSVLNTTGSAGILTAGELNDFAKWDLWNDISSTDLNKWQDYWQFKPINRYSLQIVNNAGKPVVDAKVQLLSKKDKIIWESRTDNTGKAEMWADIYEKSKNKDDLSISVTYNNLTYNSDEITQFQQGINVITVPVDCNVPKNIDIVFMVDATGSMSDEISYLKAELDDVINQVKEKYPDNTVNLGCVFYRDLGDEYVTKKFDLTQDIDKVIAFINQQYASGGGDGPEAVDSALSVAVNDLNWSDDAVARILFQILDAPPHYNNGIIESLQKNIQQASMKGIRIVPVIGSGMTKDGEYLLRSFALATNGSYIFLTDHSGVGGTHLKPTTDEYDVTLLKDLLRKIIENFVYVAPCNGPIKTTDLKDTMIVFNPEIIAHVVIDSAKTGRFNVPVLQSDTNKIVFLIDTVKSDTANTAQTDTPGSERKNPPVDFNNFKYYPNPTSGQLFIEITGEAKEIYLADISGKFLEKYEITDRKIEVNISKYSAGMYFLEYMYKDNWLTGKVVLQK